jgi:hypothetical protein
MRELQKVVLVERIERPENMILRFDLLLASADGGELVVEQETPELRAGLSRGGNAGDEEVIKLCLVSATGDVISGGCLLYKL